MASASLKFEVSCKFKIFCNRGQFQEIKRKCEDLNIKAEFLEQIDQDVYWINSSSLSKDLILKMFDVFKECDNALSKDSNEEDYDNCTGSSHESNQPRHTKTCDSNFKKKIDKQDSLSELKTSDPVQGRHEEEVEDEHIRRDKRNVGEQNKYMDRTNGRAVSDKKSQRTAKRKEEDDRSYEDSKAKTVTESSENGNRTDTQSRVSDNKLEESKSKAKKTGVEKKVRRDKKGKGDDDNAIVDDNKDDEEDSDDADNCQQEQDKGKASFGFLKGEHELALKMFKTSKSIDYLNKPCRDKSLIIIQVDDQECVKELNDFKGQVKQTKVSSGKYELVTEVRKNYDPETFIEDLDECILITALKDIHRKIKSEFPDLYENETTSPASVSVESTSRTKMKDRKSGADKNGSPPVASGLEKSTKPTNTQLAIIDRFEGHHSSLIVKVLKTDITQLPSDVIVNAANGSLKHGSGVARAIANAAGKQLHEECERHITQNGRICVSYHFASSGGNLKASQVYHAVGPRWAEYTDKEKCKQDLRHTILRCLLHAEKEGLSSIAFPSISAAIFKVPIDICVESYLKAVRHFEEMRRKSMEKLKYIYFVDINDDMVNSIKEYFALNWDNLLDASDHELRDDREIVREGFTKNQKLNRADSVSSRGRENQRKTSSGVRVPSKGRRPVSPFRQDHSESLGQSGTWGGHGSSRDDKASSKSDVMDHSATAVSSVGSQVRMGQQPRRSTNQMSLSKANPKIKSNLKGLGSSHQSYADKVSSKAKSTYSAAHGPQAPPGYYDAKTSSQNDPSSHGPQAPPGYYDAKTSSQNDPSVHGSQPSPSHDDLTSTKNEYTHPSGRHIGNMPSGVMDVRVKNDGGLKYFEIVYRIYSWHAKNDIIYMPIGVGDEGQHVLYLLMLAFCRHLTFTRDTSVTMGYHWNFIHESTLTYNPYDPKYVEQLLWELQSKGVCHDNMTYEEKCKMENYTKRLDVGANVTIYE